MEWLISAIITVFVVLLGIFLMLKKLGNDIGEAFTGFIDNFNKSMTDPTVKKAFSIIGSQGGNTKAQGVIKDKIAKGYIQKNYGTLKILADKVLGIDVDEMIEDYGAENVLSAVQSLTGQLGIEGGIPQGLGIPMGNTKEKVWYEQ